MTKKDTQRADEEYARTLQEKYRQAFLQRQSRDSATNIQTTSPMVTPSAPLYMDSTTVPASVPVQHYQPSVDINRVVGEATTGIEVAAGQNPWSSPAEATMDDEALARILQAEIRQEETVYSDSRNKSDNKRNSSMDDAKIAQEMQDAELARRYSQQWNVGRQEGGNRSIARPSTLTDPSTREVPSSEFWDERGHRQVDDTRAAQQIAQELEDAEMAQRLSTFERESMVRRQQEQQEQQQQQDTRNKCLYFRLIPLLCFGLAFAVAMLFILGIFDGSAVADAFDDGTTWIDPFDGNDGGAAGDEPQAAASSMRWRSNGNGIRLGILNAMDDSWQGKLETALTNWDQGYPIDSLTLTTERIPYETECDAVTGKMKVCNADYGDTKWRGLNEVMMNRQTNIIVSSSAMVNEYYVKGEGYDQELYTLCHELGHGFGLPHWDEDFYNKDMGNCMDYTNNPGKNMWPDQSNFLYLADLYGGENVTASESAIERAAATGGGRRLKSNLKVRSAPRPQVASTIAVADEQPNKRRVLSADDHAELHEIECEDKFEGCVKLQFFLKL